MLVKPGVRLRSAVCSTEVIVVRAPGAELDVCCGGQPMVAFDAATPVARPPISPASGSEHAGVGQDSRRASWP
jgi:hypothetical protein